MKLSASRTGTSRSSPVIGLRIERPSPALRLPSGGETLQQEGLGEDHPLDLGRVHALIRGVDPSSPQFLGAHRMNSGWGVIFCKVCSRGMEPPLPASPGGLP